MSEPYFERPILEAPVFAEPAKTPQKGRGALENPTGRFESIQIEVDRDLEDLQALEDEPEIRRTKFFKDNTQTIISHNDSPDVGFTVSINPYRGCEHGCIYCYARPTHEYLGLSPGLDFETRIFVKTKAPQLLRKALSSPSWQPQTIAMSGVTDCYQPVEKKLQITRQCLEVLQAFGNPVGIVTKNDLVTRDIDILSDMARNNAACVFISITSLVASLQQVMEPRTATPTRRFKAVEALSNAGIPVGVLMGPIVPGLTDHEIDGILKRSADAGARTAGYTMLRLPYGVKDLFQTWLTTHFPDRKDRVLHKLQQMRQGKLNHSEFGTRMVGEGTYAQYVANLFHLCKKRYGLDKGIGTLSTAAFSATGAQQLSLF